MCVTKWFSSAAMVPLTLRELFWEKDVSQKELAEAYELHEQARGKDAARAYAFLMKATTIEHLLEEIKGQ